MKSRRSLGSSIAVDAVVKQSNKRRKSVDAELINDVLTDNNYDDDDDNNKVKENKENEDKNTKKYMLRSPGLKKTRQSLGSTAAAAPSNEFVMNMDESMMEKKGGHDQRSCRTTANPNDLFDLLHDLADASCLSINSEDLNEKPSNNHHHASLSSQQQQQQAAADESARSHIQMTSSNCSSSRNQNKGNKSKGIIKPTMMINRRKTFDGVITDSFLKENDDASSGDDADAFEDSVMINKLPDRRATLDPSDLLLSVYHDVHMEHEQETGSLRRYHHPLIISSSHYIIINVIISFYHHKYHFHHQYHHHHYDYRFYHRLDN